MFMGLSQRDTTPVHHSPHQSRPVLFGSHFAPRSRTEGVAWTQCFVDLREEAWSCRIGVGGWASRHLYIEAIYCIYNNNSINMNGINISW